MSRDPRAGNPMDTEVVMVQGICQKCGHLCNQPLSQRAIDKGKPITCCGGADEKEPACGAKITNYERVTT